ncbi:MAG: laccase domain-containing protein [Thermoleophilaceae bacterium]|nr:laccase domain-containing protein [Thermoleophilaceae bacterium]
MAELRLPGARVLFTDRRGGVSEGPYSSLNLGVLTDDEPASVVENRRRAAAALGVEPKRVAMGWQVHGTELVRWDAPPADPGYARPGAGLPKADGHVTSVPGLALLVLAADCYPVALSDGTRVAMVHCGWRGLAGGILGRAVEALGDDVTAAVGPGIGACCYEVGDEVLEAFRDAPEAARGRMLDLRAIVARKLVDAGVSDVQHLEHCTSCRADLYFSHRRDGGLTGRQGGLVTLDA